MRLLVAVVGKDQKDPLKEAAQDYLRRTHTRLKPESIYIRESKRKDNSKLASEEEGKEILRATNGCYRVAMDVTGKHFSSVALAKEIEKLLVSKQQPLAFIIGGATGLSEDVLDACPMKLSLSELTLPHRLAFLVLAEQIYRAGEILRGGPYHK
jgi:23S rRNA (pseudouridine1915-N3)-methyltransferase